MANEFKVKGNGLKVNGSINLEEQGSTPSTPSAGLKIYAKTDKKVYTVDTTGAETEVGSGGAAGVNYIDNGSAEIDTTGWANYADAAAVNPVDGTAGSATAAISVVTATTLRGAKHFRITKDAANRQGEGSSYAFTIDGADKAKVMEVSFDYLASSAFAEGSSSDVRVWVYDVTNSALIGVTPHYLDGVAGSNHKFTGSFQSAPDSTSYRLIFHIATTNASAWTLDFDKVSISPSSQMKDVGGSVAASLAGCTTSIASGVGLVQLTFSTVNFDTHSAWSTNVYTAPNTGYYQINAYVVLNLTTTEFNTDSEYMYLALYKNDVNVVDFASKRPVSGIDYPNISGAHLIKMNAGDTLKFYFAQTSGSTFSIHTTSHTEIIQIPSPAPTAVGDNVVAIAHKVEGTQTIAAAATAVIEYDEIEYDTHGAFSGIGGSSFRFTAPYSGYYQVNACTSINLDSDGADTEEGLMYVYLNGSVSKKLAEMQLLASAAAEAFLLSGSTAMYLGSGDYIDIRVLNNGSQTSSVLEPTLGKSHHVSIFKIDSKAVNVAEEKVVAICVKVDDPQSIAASAIDTIEFDEIDTDTHSAISGLGTSSFKFTAPHTGYYHTEFTVVLSVDTDGDVDAESLPLLYKNNALVVYAGDSRGTTNTAATTQLSAGSVTVQLNAGDYIDWRVHNSTVNSMDLVGETTAAYHRFSIFKI